jgi:hypothetical protein
LNSISFTHQFPSHTTPPSSRPNTQKQGARSADRDTKTTGYPSSPAPVPSDARGPLFSCRSCRRARESWHRMARSMALRYSRKPIAVVGSWKEELSSCSCDGRRRHPGCRRRCCRRGGGRGLSSCSLWFGLRCCDVRVGVGGWEFVVGVDFDYGSWGCYIRPSYVRPPSVIPALGVPK